MRLRRRRQEREPEPEPPRPKMCARRMHELTPDITYTDRRGIDHCRQCWADGFLNPPPPVVRDPFFRS